MFVLTKVYISNLGIPTFWKGCNDVMDTHVHINQEHKLTILSSELERKKHLNFFVSHVVKRPIENKKTILVGYHL